MAASSTAEPMPRLRTSGRVAIPRSRHAQAEVQGRDRKANKTAFFWADPGDRQHGVSGVEGGKGDGGRLVVSGESEVLDLYVLRPEHRLTQGDGPADRDLPHGERHCRGPRWWLGGRDTWISRWAHRHTV